MFSTARNTERLARLRRLRELNAPLWVIKTEQISMLAERRGTPGDYTLIEPLLERHVRDGDGGLRHARVPQ